MTKLWDVINKNVITKEAKTQIASFKDGPINYRLGIWNPHTNGIRYYKMLIYNLAQELTTRQTELIKKTKNRQIGKPTQIIYNLAICMDYLQATYEASYLETYISINKLKIAEIGAGFGRTCHLLLSNYNIEEYHIIDLPNCLSLSSIYLKLVLPKKLFSKIKFIDANTNFNYNYDLILNIDGLNEMPVDQVYHYLQYVDQHCHYFYTKNPVGKYNDEDIQSDHKTKKLAMSMGILKNIVDINNNKDIKQNAKLFTRSFRPSNKWKCVHNCWAKPFTFYWQAIYKK